MRICKEYLPNKLGVLQEEYEKEAVKTGKRYKNIFPLLTAFLKCVSSLGSMFGSSVLFMYSCFETRTPSFLQAQLCY